MKYHILVSGKNKKNYFKLSTAEKFTQSAKRQRKQNIHPLKPNTLHALYLMHAAVAAVLHAQYLHQRYSKLITKLDP